MASNAEIFDRLARVIIGCALISFTLGYIAPGTCWNWVGVVSLLTAVFGTCPFYSIVGCSTK